MDLLSKTEKITLKLIQADLQFLFTILQNKDKVSASYFVTLMPYMGLIIDGCETWSNKVAPLKAKALRFSPEEKWYYSELRNSIKLWETPFPELNNLLKQKYNESDIYFSSLCKPIAKTLKLYDIFGVYLVNGEFCDNTILDTLFVPKFEFGHINGEYIKDMATIAGKMIALFKIPLDDKLKTDNSISFNTKDYGGFIKSPLGNIFCEEFVLFSMLCVMNFIIYGVNKYIIPDTSTKLRLAYIQYYYLAEQLPQINKQFGTQFSLSSKWIDTKGTFRNCMAHYGLGMALSQDEVIETDLFGGLTQKIFHEDWKLIKDGVVEELSNLSAQLRVYLGI